MCFLHAEIHCHTSVHSSSGTPLERACWDHIICLHCVKTQPCLVLQPAGIISFVCIAWRHDLVWCCSLLGSHHLSALHEDMALTLQVQGAGRHHCSGCCRCDHFVFGSVVLVGCAANHICRESSLLPRALSILLPFFAFLSGTVYCGASVYLCPSVCVHLHHLLVLWV